MPRSKRRLIMFGFLALVSCVAEPKPQPEWLATPPEWLVDVDSLDASDRREVNLDVITDARELALHSRFDGEVGLTANYEFRTQGPELVLGAPGDPTREVGIVSSLTLGGATPLTAIARYAKTNSVQSLLSTKHAVVETATARSNGLEVAWTITRPLIATDSQVTATFSLDLGEVADTQVDDDGVHMSTSTIPVTIGHAKLIDASGAVTHIRGTVRGAVVAFTLDPELQRSIKYPAVLDPLISSEAFVDGKRPNVNLGTHGNPAVAGDSGGFVVVWVAERTPIEGAVYFTSMSASGVPWGQVTRIVTGPNPGTPTISQIQNNIFVVAWSESDGQIIRGTTIDRSTMFEPTSYFSVPSGGAVLNQKPSLACKLATKCILAYESKANAADRIGISATLLTPIGAQSVSVGTPFTIQSTSLDLLAPSTSLAPDDSGSQQFAALWISSSGSLLATTVSHNGALSPITTVCTVSGMSHPQLNYIPGSGFHISAYETGNVRSRISPTLSSGCGALATIPGTGNNASVGNTSYFSNAGAERIVYQAAGGIKVGRRNSSWTLAETLTGRASRTLVVGNTFIVVYANDWSIHTATFVNGSVSSVRATLANNFISQSAVAVAAGPQEFMVAWQNNIFAKPQVWTSRFSLTGQLLGPPVGPSLGFEEQLAPAVAFVYSQYWAAHTVTGVKYTAVTLRPNDGGSQNIWLNFGVPIGPVEIASNGTWGLIVPNSLSTASFAWIAPGQSLSYTHSTLTVGTGARAVAVRTPTEGMIAYDAPKQLVKVGSNAVLGNISIASTFNASKSGISIAAGGDKYLVLGARTSGSTSALYGALYTPSFSQSRLFPVYSQSSNWESPSVAFDGNEYLVVYFDTAAQNVVANSVRTNGDVRSRVVVAAADAGANPQVAAIADDKFAIAYTRQGRTYFRIMNTDDDGDGYTWAEGDCSLWDPYNWAYCRPCEDNDNDGYWGNCDYYAGGPVDCDDYDNSVFPGAFDPCGGPNTDCIADIDADGDGYAGAGCDDPPDCDDSRSTVHPGATEYCDFTETDDDCDGLANDLDPSVVNQQLVYLDADGDGFGNLNISRLQCYRGNGYTQGGDCNDARADINPNMPEVCDPLDTDENCNGKADDLDNTTLNSTKTAYYFDIDGDGFGDPNGYYRSSCEPISRLVTNTLDCDDGNSNVYPRSYYVDADDDGFGADLGAPLVLCEGAYQAPVGFAERGGDCDDTYSAVYPGALELCDAVDNDCNGQVDETWPELGRLCFDGVGQCRVAATWQCSAAGAAECSGAQGIPELETCNGLDDNCDGRIDEACFAESCTGGLSNIGLSGLRCDDSTILAAAALEPAANYGEIPVSFQVDETGQSNFVVPVQLPPGRAGVMPSLAFAYNSGSLNGPMGMGWSLAGLPVISRCAKTYGRDGIVQSPKWSDADALCFNGKRLIIPTMNSCTDGGQELLEEHHISGRICASGAGATRRFKYYDQQGLVYELVGGISALTEGTTTGFARWSVERVSDRDGNFYTVVYEIGSNDQASTSGTILPKEIQYTGYRQTIAPTWKIQFNYEARPDNLVMYSLTKRSDLTKRLANVAVIDAAGVVVHRYRFTYRSASLTNGLSELETIQLCDNAEHCIPRTLFKWYERSRLDYMPPTTLGALNALDSATVKLADFNADGVPDLYDRRSAFISGGGSSYFERLDFGAPPPAGAVVAFDEDDDGDLDILWLTDPTRIARDPSSAAAVHYDNPPSLVYANNVWVGDLDGDGRDDLVARGNFDHRFYFYRNTPGLQLVDSISGYGTAAATVRTSQLGDSSFQYYGPNEDGAMRRFRVRFAMTQGQPILDIQDTGGSLPTTAPLKKVLLDINGDGYTDTLVGDERDPNDCLEGCEGGPGSTITLRLGNAGSVSAEPISLDLGGPVRLQPSTVGDWDGDGVMDCVVAVSNSVGPLVVSFVNGALVTRPLGQVGNPVHIGDVGIAGDFNRDGQLDVLEHAVAGWKIYASTGTPYIGPFVKAMYSGFNQDVTPTDMFANVTLSYRHNRDPIARSQGSPSSCAAGLQCLPSPGFIVTQVNNNDRGDRGTYKYGGGARSRETKEFAGYHSIEFSDFRADRTVLTTFAIKPISRGGIYHPLAPSSRKETVVLDDGKVFVTENQFVQSGNARNSLQPIHLYKSEMQRLDGASVFNRWTTADLNDFGHPVEIDEELTSTGSIGGGAVHAEIQAELGRRKLRTHRNFTYASYADGALRGLVIGERSELETPWLEAPPNVIRSVASADYSPVGRATKVTLRNPSTLTAFRTLDFVHDQYGNLTQVTTTADNALGLQEARVVKFFYDEELHDFPTFVADGLGHATSFGYRRATGLPYYAVLPDGSVHTWSADSLGRALGERTADGAVKREQWSSSPVATASARLTYRNESDWLRAIDFDRLGRPLGETVNLLGNDTGVRAFEYDAFDRLATIGYFTNSGETQSKLTLIYDELGRIVAEIGRDGTTTHSYAPFVETTTDANGHSHSIYSDAFGNIIGSRDASGTWLRHHRDGIGRLLRIDNPTEADSSLYDAEYDEIGNLVRVRRPNSGTVTLSYNGFGEVIEQYHTTANESISTHYDGIGRVYLSDAGGKVTTHVWDGLLHAGQGKLASRSSPDGVTDEFLYHPENGLLASQSRIIDGNFASLSFRTEYTYQAGRLATVRLPRPQGAGSRSVTYDYASIGSLLQVRSEGETLWRAVSMYPDGGSKQSLIGAGELEEFGRHSVTNRLETIARTYNGHAIYSLGLEHDGGGNVHRRFDNWGVASSVPDADRIYHYSASDAVESIDQVIGSSSAHISLSYDWRGNIRARTDVGTYGYTTTLAPDQLTSFGGLACFHDTKGDLLSDGHHEFSFDARGVLTSVETMSTTTTLGYDASNSFAVQSGEGIQKVKSPSVLISGATANVARRWVYPIFIGQRLVGLIIRDSSTERVVYVVEDDQGTVVGATDGAGNVLSQRVYDPFGRIIESQGLSLDDLPFGYTQHYQDFQEGRLIVTPSRIYDPSKARFASPDPTLVGTLEAIDLNPYAYARNNPATYVDLNGYMANVAATVCTRARQLEGGGTLIEQVVCSISTVPSGFGNGGTAFNLRPFYEHIDPLFDARLASMSGYLNGLLGTSLEPIPGYEVDYKYGYTLGNTIGVVNDALAIATGVGALKDLGALTAAKLTSSGATVGKVAVGLGIAVPAVGLIASGANGLGYHTANLAKLQPLESRAKEPSNPQLSAESAGAGTSTPPKLYASVKDAPKYPKEFRNRQNGLKFVNVNDEGVLEWLRSAKSGGWRKAYRDGYVGAERRSVHYWQHDSGLVTGVKVVNHWSQP